MIETIRKTQLYNSMGLSKLMHHAYLFHSLDKVLNNEIALTFAKSKLCNNSNSCNECFSCAQFNKNSHPDFVLIDQQSVKVEDINSIINKLSTKPISSNYKIILILNAETINEIAQNKLLKSLEEPNNSTIFILSTSKIDKLLPTVLSRLHKINVEKPTAQDFSLIKAELLTKGVNIEKYQNSNFNLTDIINFETDENYKKTINAIKFIFSNLKSSQDIPHVTNSIPEFDKSIFLKVLEMVFLSCINNENIFDDELHNLINSTFSQKALIHSIPLIEDAYKKQMANVNFGYILDNLLFNILKEKFLCRQ
ncbi:MAG: hypothetical protein IKY10_05215 [Clostridia bacterium]|nr:hypothetical protein [Clostridia bacterium]